MTNPLPRPSERFEETSLLEALGTAVMVFDAALRLVYMNPAAEALLGLSRRQVHGAPAGALLGALGAPGGLLGRALALGSTLTEYEASVSTGTEHSLSLTCTVTPLSDGDAPSRVLLEMHSLDPPRRASTESRVQSVNASWRALLRGLAHEIRNPLGGLRGAAQLLERELPQAQWREYTQVIIGEADRLQRLLERLLEPRRAPALREINVHEVTERVFALLQAQAPERCQLRRDYDPSLPPVVADPELLVQAVLNIARNAVQALEQVDAEQPRELCLRTRIQRNAYLGANYHRLVVRLEVHDTGPGVPRALREHLFFPMVSGRPDGSGLGLSIAHALVAQQGGSLEFDSEPGDTTFSVLLPVGGVR